MSWKALLLLSLSLSLLFTCLAAYVGTPTSLRVHPRQNPILTVDIPWKAVSSQGEVLDSAIRLLAKFGVASLLGQVAGTAGVLAFHPLKVNSPTMIACICAARCSRLASDKCLCSLGAFVCTAAQTTH